MRDLPGQRADVDGLGRQFSGRLSDGHGAVYRPVRRPPGPGAAAGRDAKGVCALAAPDKKEVLPPLPGAGQPLRDEAPGDPFFRGGEERRWAPRDLCPAGCQRGGGAGGDVQTGGAAEPGGHPGGRQDRHLDH